MATEYHCDSEQRLRSEGYDDNMRGDYYLAEHATDEQLKRFLAVVIDCGKQCPNVSFGRYGCGFAEDMHDQTLAQLPYDDFKAVEGNTSDYWDQYHKLRMSRRS